MASAEEEAKQHRISGLTSSVRNVGMQLFKTKKKKVKKKEKNAK